MNDEGKSLVHGSVSSSSDSVWIYGLADETGLIRYIGKAKDPQKRLKQHVRDARARRGINNHKEAWIRQVLACGCMPGLVVLQQCDSDTWQDAERKQIAKHGLWLTNMSQGGVAPECDAKTRSSLARKLNQHPDAPLFMAIRIINHYARSCVKAGHVQRARKLIEAALILRDSRGDTREKLKAWASEKFNGSIEKAKVG